MSVDPLLNETVKKITNMMTETLGLKKDEIHFVDFRCMMDRLALMLKDYKEKCVTEACNDCFEGSGLSLSEWVKKKEKEKKGNPK